MPNEESKLKDLRARSLHLGGALFPFSFPGSQFGSEVPQGQNCQIINSAQVGTKVGQEWIFRHCLVRKGVFVIA